MKLTFTVGAILLTAGVAVDIAAAAPIEATFQRRDIDTLELSKVVDNIVNALELYEDDVSTVHREHRIEHDSDNEAEAEDSDVDDDEEDDDDDDDHHSEPTIDVDRRSIASSLLKGGKAAAKSSTNNRKGGSVKNLASKITKQAAPHRNAKNNNKPPSMRKQVSTNRGRQPNSSSNHGRNQGHRTTSQRGHNPSTNRAHGSNSRSSPANRQRVFSGINKSRLTGRPSSAAAHLGSNRQRGATRTPNGNNRNSKHMAGCKRSGESCEMKALSHSQAGPSRRPDTPYVGPKNPPTDHTDKKGKSRADPPQSVSSPSHQNHFRAPGTSPADLEGGTHHAENKPQSMWSKMNPFGKSKPPQSMEQKYPHLFANLPPKPTELPPLNGKSTDEHFKLHEAASKHSTGYLAAHAEATKQEELKLKKSENTQRICTFVLGCVVGAGTTAAAIGRLTGHARRSLSSEMESFQFDTVEKRGSLTDLYYLADR